MFKKIATSLLVIAFLVAQIVIPVKSVQAVEYPTINWGEVVAGNITETSYKNTYKVVVPKSGKLDISLSSQIYDLDVDLEDEAGNKAIDKSLYDGNEQNPAKDLYEVELEAGTYYLNIGNDGWYTGQYNFTVNYINGGTNDIEPNNGTVTAQALTLNSTPITGYLTWNDDKDVYKISLAKAGKIDIVMTSQIGDTDVDLETSDGTKIADDTIYDGSAENPKSWLKSYDLEAGNYYFKVSQNYTGSTGKYTVKVNYTAANNNDVEPNNGTLTAQPINLNSSALTGYISWNDDQDVYKVVLTKPGRIDITMLSKINDVYVSLENSSGNKIVQDEIYYGSQQNPKLWKESLDLEAGTYYLKTYKYYDNSTGTYSVQINYTGAGNNDIEPNDGTVTAQTLTPNLNALVGYLPYGDTQDVYKIVLSKTGKITLNLTSWMEYVQFKLNTSLGLTVWDNNIYGSTLQAPKTLADSITLSAGTYYLVASRNQYDDTGKYAVKVSTYNQVAFYSNGGSAVTSQTLIYNGKVVKPANPIRAGYTFGGWYKDSALVNLFDFNTPITADTTLYAKWIANAPAVPANAKAVSSSYNTITSSWSAVSFANGYELYRATVVNGTYSKVGETTALMYSNTGLTTGTTYYYKVRAYRTVGTSRLYSGYSTIVSAKPVLAKPVAASVAVAGYNSLKTAWAAVVGASGYELYRSTSATGTYSKVVETTGTTYTNTGLSTGTLYYYKVRAYKTVGTTRVYSDYSAIVNARPILSTPTGLRASLASSSAIKISWNAVSGADAYEVYRSTSLNGSYSKIITTNSTSTTNTGLQKYTNYYYKVRAYRKVGTTIVYSNFSSIGGWYIY